MRRRPSDWPQQGAIDLSVHDLPHKSSATEWWYLNSHLETKDGRQLAIFVAFFRIIAGRDEVTKEPIHAHSITWALSDLDAGAYFPDSRVDDAAPTIGLKQMENGDESGDPRLNRAMREILERGNVPLPDRKLAFNVFVGERQLELDYGCAQLKKCDDGSYQFSAINERDGVGCDLNFRPLIAPVRHGDDGVVRGPAGEDMFYYFIPRCEVSGDVTVNGVRSPVAQGSGWYDHEFGGRLDDAEAHNGSASAQESADSGAEEKDIAWNWAAVQLDDGSQVTAYSLIRPEDNRILYRWAIVVDQDGKSTAHPEMILEPLAWWRSTRTFHDYPTRWRLAVPDAGLDIELNAKFPDQEFMTVLSKPAFWEGRMEVQGTIEGKSVTGRGYVERSGFEPVRNLDDFFSAVGEEVRKSVASLLPLEPNAGQLQMLVASEERAHYMDGVDASDLTKALIYPIREIVDRGGKSWRSYAALACCDVVGGDSRKFVQWLAVPELMHVGSLIIDDVQDRSTVRRGKPTCHMLYGEPLAINAGTAAYFITQKLLVSDELSAAKKLKLYDLYFESMRAGHAGQALDLAGLSDVMQQVIRDGDASVLEERVLATHRLKTAAPAGALARMGAVAGGGSEAQVEAVGDFFEALGLAFQIIDDVLNVRGFKGNLKSVGEDITQGTVTLPVAKAMVRLDHSERQWLASTLSSRPKDEAVVGEVIGILERCGAVDACVAQAADLVETAWQRAEPLLDDSVPKVMLRAFGWYVLERHY